MLKDLQSIFESITPDNIQDVPLIKDAMGMFIETLEELSKESIDIKNAYNNDNIKSELIKIYLDDLYNVLKAAQLNEKLIETIDKYNSYHNIGRDPELDPIVLLDKDAFNNMSNYINSEHFLSFKSYKQKKGTPAAIEYIYELINGWVSVAGSENSAFRFIEGDNPFHFDIEGSLPEEFYEYIIWPLAHPLGFTYSYERYLALSLEDYFPTLNITYDTALLEVRTLYPNGTSLITTFINSSLSQAEQEALGLDLTLAVTKVEALYEGSDRVKIITLNDDTYLKQVTTSTGQTEVWHYESDGDVELHHYDQQSSIYFDYTFDVHTSLTEDISYVSESVISDSSEPFDDSGETLFVYRDGVLLPDNNTSFRLYPIIGDETTVPGALEGTFIIGEDHAYINKFNYTVL